MEPSGLPPRVAEARERALAPWEVNAYRVWFTLGPIALAGVSVALGNPGGAVMALMPPLQLFLMPQHQRNQVLGRR